MLKWALELISFKKILLKIIYIMRFITILLILIHKVLGDEDDCDMEFDMPFCSFKGISRLKQIGPPM